ncbi:unnamed protein product [Brassica napus]|uniref:(rape) hypothetical protein n=1 Tax=Brassica napus TaxID=3708 RepID=A0A816KWL0_BRANA|nr:unnamed protein product [Brassica napus]
MYYQFTIHKGSLYIPPSCSRCFSFRVLIFTSTGPCTDKVGLNNT